MGCNLEGTLKTLEIINKLNGLEINEAKRELQKVAYILDITSNPI